MDVIRGNQNPMSSARDEVEAAWAWTTDHPGLGSTPNDVTQTYDKRV